MAETFDALGCGSGPECVKSLKAAGVAVSQRLGARLVALARRRLQFSLAALEEATPGSPLEALLLSHDSIERLESALQAFAHLRMRREGEETQVVTVDEADVEGTTSSSSLLPALLGAPVQSHLHGSLFDRARMEEAALSFLDGEDDQRVVESCRYLFRAALQAGQDPLPLLLSAFRRQKLPLSLEAAALIKTNLSKDMGRSLEDLLSDRPARVREGLSALVSARDDRWSRILQVLLLPVLTQLLKNPENLHTVLSVLPSMAAMRWDNTPGMEDLLDGLLVEAVAYDSPERIAIGSFLVALQETWSPLVEFVSERLRRTRDQNLRAFYLSVLSRVPRTPEVERQCIETAVDTVLQGGHDAGFQERMRLTLLKLGPAVLGALARAPLKPVMRPYLIRLWHESDPDPEIMAAFAVGELEKRQRASLIELSRTGLLLHEAVVERVRATTAAVDFVQDEAASLEDTEDAPVYRLLARLGLAPAQWFFARLREEGALNATSAPYRLKAFARTVAVMPPEAASALADMVEELPRYHFVREPTLPITVASLGRLGPAAPPEAARTLLEIILSRVPQWPDVALHALVDLHPNPAVTGEVEQRLLGFLQGEDTSRPVLRAALEGTASLLGGPDLPVAAESMAMSLSRIVLRRQQEASLQTVMVQALKPGDAENTGVRIPAAWDKPDRDMALVILGRLASHPKVTLRMARALTARLISFLDDWLDYQMRGRDLYLQRDTPLWTVLGAMLEARPYDDHLAEAVDGVMVRLLETHGKAPVALALERREDALRLVVQYLKLTREVTVEVRGVPLPIDHALLELLMGLSTGDATLAPMLLAELADSGRLAPPLQETVVHFLGR